MKRILLASHAHLASGAASAVQFLVGDTAEMTAIDAYVEGGEAVEEQAREFFSGVAPEDEVFILTDIKGGSVNQKLVPYANRKNVFLVSGFNMPLCLEIALADEGMTKEELERLVASCRGQMELVSTELVQDKDMEEDFLED